MKNFDQQITQLVNAFVADLTDLARAAARSTLDTALEGVLGKVTGRAPKAIATPAPAPAPTASVARASSNKRRGKGEKRSSSELTQIQDQMISYISSNPGLRIEQINKQLGTSTAELALPLRKLVKDGVFRTEGARRATKYFPGSGQRRAAARRGRKKKS